MSSFAFSVFAWIAKKILVKYRPKIIGITGSFGKSSTKDAVAGVLATKFFVRKSEKNNNNLWGSIWAIIGYYPKGFFGWLMAGFWALVAWIMPAKYPQILVLEMGVDRPGDMDEFLKLFVPSVSVITGINYSHVGNFSGLSELRSEKLKIVEKLKPTDWAVVNSDSVKMYEIESRSPARVITYGVGNFADFYISGYKEDFSVFPPATELLVSFGEETLGVSLTGLGKPTVYLALAATALGISFGVEPENVSLALSEFRYQPGRLNFLRGRNSSLIIDDTYNASPAATKEALEILARFPANKRIAVLADMLELGEYAENQHRDIGRLIADLPIDILITVGNLSALIATAAKTAGYFEENVRSFHDIFSALVYLEKIIGQGDCILVKGSQSMRMEKLVREIMAEPALARKLLCRQEKFWLEQEPGAHKR